MVSKVSGQACRRLYSCAIKSAPCDLVRKVKPPLLFSYSAHAIAQLASAVTSPMRHSIDRSEAVEGVCARVTVAWLCDTIGPRRDLAMGRTWIEGTPGRGRLARGTENERYRGDAGTSYNIKRSPL